MWNDRIAHLWRPRPRVRRRDLWIGGSIAAVMMLLYAAAFLLDEPIRRQVEHQMNARLKGYGVRLGHADFHPLGLAIDFHELIVRQDANPEPPVMHIPRLSASVEWRSLLHGKLVGDIVIARPEVYVNLKHLQQEIQDEVPPNQRGWQDALEATYPLKINAVGIRNATVTYIDHPGKPLRLHELDIHLENIKNVRSPERGYPSEVSARGIIFAHGRLAVDGRADFLATPHLAIAGNVQIESMEIDYLKPIARKYNVMLSQGTLGLRGQFEYAPKIQTAVLETVTLRGVRVDYIHTPRSAPTERVVARKTAEIMQKTADHPQKTFRVDRLDILDTTVGYVNKAAKQEYRVFLSNATLRLQDLTNQSTKGVAKAELRGKFMGSGDTEATATFRASPKGPNLYVKLAIEGTDLKDMNDILKVHGGFDVVGGRFSLYAELTAKDGAISGYVKPLFKDVVAYDPEQDRDKSFGQKLKERVVGAVSKILENRPRNEVATQVALTGRLDNPNTSQVQAVLKLVQNAFFKAILPGFEQALGRRPKPLPSDTAEDPTSRRGAPSG